MNATLEEGDRARTTMTDLYEDYILLWSERQAELLRGLAAGQNMNETPDWPNIVEEIESSGTEQLHAVTSLLRQALINTLKARESVSYQ